MVGKDRNIDLKNLLTYPLSPVPLSLSLLDGSFCKTNKAAIMPILEADVPVVESSLPQSALIVDAMALICSFSRSSLPSTFGEFAQLLLTTLQRMASKHGVTRVDFVADRYFDKSIKTVERQRRAPAEVELLVNRREQRLPKQWTKFLGNSNNKNNLLTFLANEFKQTTLDERITLVFTSNEECFCISEGGALQSVEELHADYEEADTHLVLHALHAVNSHENVIINSSDTDVAVICMYISHMRSIDNLFILTGVGRNKRLIDISAIARKNADLAPYIIGLHAFSGCDTVSSFSGKGKATVIKKLRSSEVAQKLFGQMGERFSETKSMLQLAEQVVCKLYSINANSVNAARYAVFCTASSESNMPPTEDALKFHLRRANYQAAVWKRSDKARIDAPSPDGHGWKVDENSIEIIWTEKPIAPPTLLQLSSCKCVKSRCTYAVYLPWLKVVLH